jgi:hypothetical protein
MAFDVLKVFDSTVLHAAGYDPETQRLEVIFQSGKLYCYHRVPPEVYEKLLEADSKGAFFNVAIAGLYRCTGGLCPGGDED